MRVEPLVRRSALLLLLVLAACGSERDTRPRKSGCTPNQSIACVCAPGVAGIQVCQANATFEPCQCLGFDAGQSRDAEPGLDLGFDAGSDLDSGPSPDASEPEDSGTVTDTGTFPDAEPVDTGPPDTGVHPDAAPIDTGLPTDAGFVDTGVHPDATIPDTGVHPDAAAPDSGTTPDAGTVSDAGTAACTLDSQCASGRCHPLYGQCVPDTRKLHCETCTNDNECGMPADHCLSVTIGGVPAETICAQGCSQDSQCPRGYECSLSNHCYPIPGAIRVHTCAALRDTLAGRACDPFLSTDQCGLATFDDATCVLGVGCSVGCVSNVQCPTGTTCNNWFVGDFCTVP